MSTFRQYVSRWDFMLNRCAGKSVLHLGCIGITEGSTVEKITSMVEDRVLHAHVRRICRDIVGMDYDHATVAALRQRGFTEIIAGDAQQLQTFPLSQRFEVILCGDLIEHLSQPGSMLEGIKCCMTPDAELLISTPNAFGLLHFVRYAVNVFREGNDHVLSFSRFTLQNLLQRHGFALAEVYTCYCAPPATWSERCRHALGKPFFRLFPKFGGTLICVARLM